MKKYEEITKTKSLYDHIAERFSELSGSNEDNFRGAAWECVSYIAEREERNDETAKYHYRNMVHTVKKFGLTEGQAYQVLFDELEAPK